MKIVSKPAYHSPSDLPTKLGSFRRANASFVQVHKDLAVSFFQKTAVLFWLQQVKHRRKKLSSEPDIAGIFVGSV